MNPQSQNCEPVLRESIKHFLAAYRSGNFDFSIFQSIFFRLIQSMPHPPLEIVWFYSAVTFHGAKSTPDNPFNKMLVLAKDLFQLLISCNNSSNGLEKTALLAPVVYVLYEIVHDSGLCLGWEAEDLLDKIFSFIQLSYCDDLEKCNESEHLVVCFEDLVRVWTIDRAEEGCVFEENLKVFFPVLSDEVSKGIEGRYGIDRLAGIVLCEVFWLRLCLKIRLGVLREELQKDLQNCTVQTIKGYQNSYFLGEIYSELFEYLLQNESTFIHNPDIKCCLPEMLLRMLLEPTLPINNLRLSSEDAVTLLRVLYDTVLLVDCSFLNSGRWIQFLDNKSRNLALMWSMVADNAIQFARDLSDHVRALSYANAFSKSQLSCQLIKWLSKEAGIEEKYRPHIGNPKDLIWWVSVLEDKGLGLFDQSISRLLTKAVPSKLGQDSSLPSFEIDVALSSKESIFSHSSDSKKCECKASLDEEMVDPFHDTDPAAMIAHERSSEGRRKRKEGRREVDEPRVKLVKYNFHETPIYNNKYSSGVEMGSPVCDEDMEVTVTG